MEKKEKDNLKHRIGYCLRKIISQNKDLGLDDEGSNSDNISSLRKLAASSGIEYAIVQKITSGKKNPAYTTLVAIAEGLNITLAEFFKIHDSISDEELKADLNSQKRKKSKKK